MTWSRREAVADKRPREVVAGHVVVRMAGDGDVVVVDQELDVDPFCDHREARGLGVVALHLRAIRAEDEDRLARVRDARRRWRRPTCGPSRPELNFTPGVSPLLRVSGQASRRTRGSGGASRRACRHRGPLSRYWVATRCPASSKKIGHDGRAAREVARGSCITSGTVSYAPPVWPESPFAPASAVKNTMVSRQSWMLNFKVASSSAVS